MSQSNYDFHINENAFQTIGGIKYMDIEGSYGGPVRVDNNGGQNVPTFPNATAQVFSTIYNSTDNWRTLLRGLANDHPVLIQKEQIILDIMKMVARILLILGLM